jgi:hypothetical protein
VTFFKVYFCSGKEKKSNHRLLRERLAIEDLNGTMVRLAQGYGMSLPFNYAIDAAFLSQTDAVWLGGLLWQGSLQHASQ